MRVGLKIYTAVLTAAITMSSSALADDVKLPDVLAWTAYNTGTTGYNQSVAIGKAMKDKYGIDLRVIPGKNDISRMGPLRSGKVQFSANGAGTFYASEGVFEFANPSWGPQRVHVLISSTADAGLNIATTVESGIKELKDLKGQPVAIVRGSPAVTIAMEAYLAFAGLTFDDVEPVEYGGYDAAWQGLETGQVVAAFGSTVTGPAKKIEASPRGIYWLPTPAADKEGWERLQKIAPYIVPHMVSLGTGNITKETPMEGGAYPYPILIAQHDQDPDLVYSMVKAVYTNYDSYKDALPAMKGWALERQTFKWAVPYHAAAVKFWKEEGVWTDDMEEHNNMLLKRQDILAEAWSSMKDKDLEGDAYQAEWMKVRAAALDGAGMDPTFR